MRYSYSKKIACCIFSVAIMTSTITPISADEVDKLDTEIPSAGAAVAIEDYIESSGADNDIASMLPKETAPVQTETNETNTTTTTAKPKTAEDKLFSDIAIAKVNGGEDGYVNVRKKANTNSKIMGKVYNNCGVRILGKTNDGWYKIVSGKCTGYIKAEYFATGNTAKSYALDAGYVFATVKDTGVHVRKKPTTEASVVTNVYHNETYVIKKYSKDGNWVKIKIGDGVGGWISADFVKVSVDMDTAITIKEEKAQLKAEKEAAEREAAAERAAQAAEENNNNSSNNTYSNSNNSSNSNSSNNSARRSYSSSKPSYSDGGSSSGGSAVVAYAKQFLGNPYVYGGSSLTKGTDCSGFTMSVYAHFGYSLNRSSYTQVNNGRAVSMSSLKPGDLLFYKYGGSTISHVAIYIGGGQIIHASTEETGIIISGMGSPCAARRIIG